MLYGIEAACTHMYIYIYENNIHTHTLTKPLTLQVGFRVQSKGQSPTCVAVQKLRLGTLEANFLEVRIPFKVFGFKDLKTWHPAPCDEHPLLKR